MHIACVAVYSRVAMCISTVTPPLHRCVMARRYDELFLRDPRSGKRVIFIIDSQNSSDVNHAAITALEAAVFVIQVRPSTPLELHPSRFLNMRDALISGAVFIRLCNHLIMKNFETERIMSLHVVCKFYNLSYPHHPHPTTSLSPRGRMCRVGGRTSLLVTLPRRFIQSYAPADTTRRECRC